MGRGRRGSVRLCSPSWKPAASHRPPRGHHGSRWETPKSAALLKRAHGPTGSGARQPRRLAGRGRRGRRRSPCANAQLDLWEVRSPGGAPRENPAPRPRRSRLPSAPHSGCESSCPEKGPATRTDGGSVRFGVGGSPAASASRKRRAAVRVNEVMNEHKALCSPSGTENLGARYRCGRSWFAVYGTSAQAGEREARCPDCREAVRPAGRGVSILSPGIWRAREGRAPGLLATRPTEISHCRPPHPHQKGGWHCNFLPTPPALSTCTRGTNLPLRHRAVVATGNCGGGVQSQQQK